MKKIILIQFTFFISLYAFAQVVDMSKITVSNYDEKVINDPLIDYSKFKSYSLISANVLFNKQSLTLEEKQIEFFLISEIDEVLSLKFIPFEDSSKPDLVFIYSFSNDYREKYIPPQIYSIPRWSPGGSSIISSNSNTNISTYGDINLGGRISNNTTTTITHSGKWESSLIQRPAYTEGKFFPNFSLVVYNTFDNNKIWEGNANGTSSQRDFRLAAQKLIFRLVSKMPKGSYNSQLPEENNGLIGIKFAIFNSNGIAFFPVILDIIKKSPADKKGLEKFDVMISVNGQSTANKTYNQISNMLKGTAGTKINIIIDRKGKIIKKTLIKMKRDL